MRTTMRGRLAAALAVAVVAAVAVAGCGGDNKSTAKGAVTLTLWSWVPDLQQQVDLFTKAHPNIKVQLVNAGQGAAEYTKLRTAFRAGSGAPDVAQIEFQLLPSFRVTGDVVDIAPYGAGAVKADYVDWAWAQVSEGSAVYALPWDSGPMGLLYRSDILAKHGIKVPTTWDEFATAARALHAADPKVYLTNFPPNEGGVITGLAWQAGSRPFEVKGKTSVQVHVDDPGAVRMAQFWDRLISEGVVSTDPDFTDEWYRGLNTGRYATWVTAAWGPVFLSGSAKDTAGKWRAAPLPQWSGGEQVSANWGGSTLAVTKQSKHPKEAAELAIWLMHDPEATKLYTTKQFLFPVLKNLLSSPDFVDQKFDFYGGQQVNHIFSQAAQQVDVAFQWSPFQDFVYSTMNDEFGKAIGGPPSLVDALHAVQQKTTDFAKSQGFEVG
ncbi:MAG TPA: sugar ABC transporter substrate-binding protein [Micromonosporaceae bacterium]|jgi:multiple sugar transport system substrate-binding protein